MCLGPIGEFYIPPTYVQKIFYKIIKYFSKFSIDDMSDVELWAENETLKLDGYVYVSPSLAYPSYLEINQ